MLNSSRYLAGVAVALGLVWMTAPGAVLAADATRASLEQAQKALDTDLDALHQRGEPARPEDLIRPSIPDAANAVLDLRAAAKAIDRQSKALRTYDDISGPITLPLAPEQAEIIRTLVKENAAALKLIRSAVAKGKADWQRKYATPLIKVLLPDLADMRMLANLLQPAAMLAHEDGDDIAALEYVRELLFVSRAAGDEPFIVSHLVEIGIDAMAFDVCRQIVPTLQLGKEPAMREQLRSTITQLLDEVEFSAHMRRAMQGERVVPVDTAIALSSGKLTLDELPDLLGPAARDSFRGLKQEEITLTALVDARLMLSEMTRLIEAASAKDLPTARAKTQPWPRAQNTDPAKHLFMAMMLPSLENAFSTHYRGLAQRRLAATALAIRWYAMDHDDKYPKALQDLVQAYLPAVPTDPMTIGDPLVYAPDKGLLYSVGFDGQDDAGAPGDGRSPGHDDIAIALK